MKTIHTDEASARRELFNMEPAIHDAVALSELLVAVMEPSPPAVSQNSQMFLLHELQARVLEIHCRWKAAPRGAVEKLEPKGSAAA